MVFITLFLAVLLVPSIAFAQPVKAGVVTVLEGNVTARRLAQPDVVPLKFKDDVFERDTVTTGDKSLARMLLGGKAVVTVRERSVLTITETPGRSTLELASGKFALAVAREKMAPGEEIQIRTPNAVAGVRGTVVVTEVNRQGAQTGSSAAAVVTTFFVLRGTIVAQQLDGSRQPVGTPVPVGALQAYSGAGAAAPSVRPVAPEQVGQITAGLQPAGQKNGTDAGKEQIKTLAVQTTLALANTLARSERPVDLPARLLANPVRAAGPDQEGVIKERFCREAATDCLQKIASFVDELALAARVIGGVAGVATFQNRPARDFTEDFTSTQTESLLSAINAVAVQLGAGVPFMRIAPGVKVTLAGPLLTLIDSSLATQGSLLEILGSLTGTSASALLSLDPSSLHALEAVLNLSGPGARLGLAGPLFTDVGGTLLVGSASAQARAFLSIVNGAAVTGTSGLPFVSLTDSTLATEGFLAVIGSGAGTSSLVLAGPLLRTSGGSIVATDFVTVRRGSITGTAPQPFIQLMNTTVATSSVVSVLDGAALAIGGGSPLLALAGGSLSAPSGHLLLVRDLGSTVALSGGLLATSQASLSIGGSVLQLGPLGTVITGPGPSLVTLDQTALSLGSLVSADGAGRRLLASAPLLAANNQSAVTSTGPLLSATLGGFVRIDRQTTPIVAFSGGSTLSAQALLTAGLADALVFTNMTTAPLFAFNGGSHVIAKSGSSAIELRGTVAADVDVLSGESEPGGVTIEVTSGDGSVFIPLTVATDRPLMHDGSLIHADGATLSAARGVTLDRALFEATAPLINLANGSTMTVSGAGGHGVNLLDRSRLESKLTPMMKLDGSTLSILSGHGLNVTGGSFVRVLGADLISLTNGSRLSIVNGNLLNITGNSAVQVVNGTVLAIHNSQVTIGGAFVNVQAGSGLGVINNLNFTNVGGLPIAFINGASSANVSITNPIQGSGNYSVHNSAAVLMSGPNASLTISGN